MSFKDPNDFTKAMREMQGACPSFDLHFGASLLLTDPLLTGKYIGNRPVKLKKSAWQERSVDVRSLKRLDVTGAVVKQ